MNNDKNSNSIIYIYDKPSEYVSIEYVPLNNYHISPFKLPSGESFQSVEHYYQCHKFDDLKNNTYYESVKNAPSPDESKKLSRLYTNGNYKQIKPIKWSIKRWENGYKDVIMKQALMYKFSQHLEILKILIDTKDKRIVESSPKDAYWGGLIEGSLNKLGNMLMDLRANFNKNKVIFIEGSMLDPIIINIEKLYK